MHQIQATFINNVTFYEKTQVFSTVCFHAHGLCSLQGAIAVLFYFKLFYFNSFLVMIECKWHESLVHTTA